MAYVVYHKDTTRYLSRHPNVKTDREFFETQGLAKSTLTREVKRGAVVREDFLITDISTFAHIEKTVTVTKHGNGSIPPAPYEISVNTPYVSDPRFERYWSM